MFQVIADLTGGLLNTRIGNLVAKVLESDVRKSVDNLAALALTPFVVHGTRFVARLDGFDSAASAGA